ncbi:MAG TPA: chemotaxis protein CheA [Myxococcales bacterium]|nr:chemotaxis protein CheA [Myxococcales bacterium]
MPSASHKYLTLFVAEASEHLATLQSELVRLEQEPPAAPLWDAIFRRMHSVKGSAATLGFSRIVDIAHAAENLIARLKGKEGKIERAEVDLLFAATDALVKEIVKLDKKEEDESTITLVDRLAKAAQALPDPALTAARPAPPPPVPPVADPSLPRLDVAVVLSKTCAAPGARAMIVQRKLKAMGTLLELEPTPAQLMQQKGGARITALLATLTATDEVREALVALPEVDHVEVRMAPAARPPEEGPPPPPVPVVSPPQAAMREKTPMPGRSLTPAPMEPGELRPEPTVRVRAEALDQLLDQAADVMHGIARLRDAAKRLPEPAAARLEAEIDRLRRTARELHGRVMSARLTPFSSLTERLPRAVRDLAHRLNKTIELDVQGADVELDRTVIEALGDPLSHLVRNAADHGLEDPETRKRAGKPGRGKLTLSARRERDKVFVEVQDDGRGMDAAALRRKAVKSAAMTKEAADALSDDAAYELAFLPGVSTRDDATEVSGRGVGLDAVQRKVESLGGKVSIRSTPGKGTTFVLELPLSLSMANLLLVQVGGEIYGVPLHRVLLTTDYDLSARGGEGFEARSLVVMGELVRAYGLAKLFGLPSLAPPGPRPFVVMEVDGLRFAISVDRLVGQEESVLKPLFPPLDRVRGLAGITVLGNGRPLLVLDPRGLAELCGIHDPLKPAPAAKGAA